MENVKTKPCRECGNIYPVAEKFFYKHKMMADGFLNVCKLCLSEKAKKDRVDNSEKMQAKSRRNYLKHKVNILASQMKSYYKNHEENKKNRREREATKEKKEIRREQRKRYREKNAKKIDEANKAWVDSPAGQKYRKRYKEKNKERIRENLKRYNKERRASDKQYRLLTNLRTRLNSAVKKEFKKGKTIELLGCSIQQLKEHLEKQFQPGMTWDNWSINGWHIDHIIPCSYFDMSKIKDQEKCFHFSNLQPLWAIDNLKKHAKVLTF